VRLTDAIGQLTATFIDWDGLLVNAEYVHRGQTITWQRDEHTMVPELLAFSDVAMLAERRQYSFQLLTDGSLFQLYYRYDKDATTLTNAMLAYYEGSSEEDGDEAATNVVSESDEHKLPRWLRIDFSNSDPKCSLHNDCHLHIGGLRKARVPLDGVPNPKQFVDLVMAWCYPELYAEHCLTGDSKSLHREPRRQEWVHEEGFPFVDDLVFKQMIHLRVPRH